MAALKCQYGIWMDQKEEWRCAKKTAGIAHANSVFEHGYELRRKIEVPTRKAVPGWCYNDQCLQGASETIDMLCCNLSLVFTGAHADAEDAR
jgi:hypothetical protein